MGCVESRIDKEERVQICKQRKRLMKLLVGFRREFAAAQLAYLMSLKNTGVTLRQFTESESLEPENTSYAHTLPPSPPLPLPPSPPPPPSFSPDLRKSSVDQKEVAQEEIITIDDDDCSTSLPPPIPSSSWNNLDPFEPSSLHHLDKTEVGEIEAVVEEENWLETKTEFEQEDQEEEAVGNFIVDSVPKKKQAQQPVELADDNSSMMSWHTKDTSDMNMVVWRNKKTLEAIIKDLDDYFLKASAVGKEVAVLMDIYKGEASLSQSLKENKRKGSNSAKVFTALSWSWSSKSVQSTKDAAEVCCPTESCMPGAHCVTLDKLYAAEQKIYREVKEEEMTKIEHEKKSRLLLRQEEENHDWTKTEKTRSSVESLDTGIRHLQHSISTTCSSILEVIDVELYPQLIAITSGLKNMWRTMYKCHQAQKHISQQLNHLNDSQIRDFTTDYHRQATIQLEAEITYWHSSFCKLVKFQREYVMTLCGWIQLTACLVDDNQLTSCSSAVHSLCEEWRPVLDRLPDKVASEAIESLLSDIQSIRLQQAEEQNLHKKSYKLEKRLQKELSALDEMEEKVYCSSAAGDEPVPLSPKHPLSLRRARTEALKKRVETERAKYLNSVQITRIMTLSKLKASLPNVFQALMEFSSASAQAFEKVLRHGKPEEVDCDVISQLNELKVREE